MPGRGLPSSTGYRYGFNGKEDDQETVGTGNGTQDYGMRIYNPSLGKFLSVDPLTKAFPMLTPYQFASNNPILYIDLDGLEGTVKRLPAPCPALTNTGQLFLDGFENGYALGFSDLFSIQYWRDFALSMVTPWSFPNLESIGASIQVAPYESGESYGRILGQNVGLFILTEGTALAIEGASSTMRLGKIIEAEQPFVHSTKNYKTKFNQSLLTEEQTSITKTWYRYNKIDVGIVENFKDGWRIELNIDKEYQNIGIGAEIFKKAANEYGYSPFYAMWQKSPRYSDGMSVNLEIFNTEMRMNNLSKEEAAWKTWSGQQAKKAGYNCVDVKIFDNGNVEAKFSIQNE